jgi:pyruvate dehydrogenase E2 component (dihydrolipoamide acetyltransferase)
VAEITMPRLSDSMQEGTIVRWLVADGTQVAIGDEVAEIETDKATMTFEADLAGVLNIGAVDGVTLPVGAVIATVGNVERARASPVARRIAAELGIDLIGLVGSGPQGRIVKRDVETARDIPGRHPEVAVPASPEVVAGVVVPDASAREDITVVELTRVQRTIARRMAEAKATMPDFTVSMDVDMDAAVQLRVALKAAVDDGPAPSYNDLVVKAAALALRAHPKVNGAYRNGRFELFSHVNVGVAVAVDGALLVATVVDADRRSLGSIAAETRRLAGAGRDGTLSAGDLSGATFSVSNLGMFGVTQFTAVLNPPQAAILAVGALQQQAIVRDGAVAPGWRMSLTLTCDHRIIYGADAAAFLAQVRAGLEQPLRLAL